MKSKCKRWRRACTLTIFGWQSPCRGTNLPGSSRNLTILIPISEQENKVIFFSLKPISLDIKKKTNNVPTDSRRLALTPQLYLCSSVLAGSRPTIKALLQRLIVSVFSLLIYLRYCLMNHTSTSLFILTSMVL